MSDENSGVGSVEDQVGAIPCLNTSRKVWDEALFDAMTKGCGAGQLTAKPAPFMHGDVSNSPGRLRYAYIDNDWVGLLIRELNSFSPIEFEQTPGLAAIEEWRRHLRYSVLTQRYETHLDDLARVEMLTRLGGNEIMSPHLRDFLRRFNERVRDLAGMDKSAQESVGTGVDRLNGNCDAVAWADEFMRIRNQGVPVDHGLMIGWFANAIETGRDAGNAQQQSDTEARQLREAMGLLTTLYPQMEVNPYRPVEMAQQIVAYVTETIDTLRADLEAKKGRLELIERTDTAQENQRLHDRVFGLNVLIDERDNSIVRLREAMECVRSERDQWMEQSAQQADEIGRLKAFIDHRDDPSGPCETLRTAAGDEVAFVITRGSRG